MKNSPSKKSKSSVKQGQIWKLGEHRLLCGSSLDPKLIGKLIGDLKINAIISDVPYGVSYTQSKEGFSPVKVRKNILNDDIRSETEYTTFSMDWLKLLLPHLTKKNSIYIFNSDKMLFALKDALDELDITFSQLLIWVKNHAVIGRKDYLPQHELIVSGWYGTHAFKRSKDKSVICYPKPNKSSLHPTSKPVGLIRHLVLNSTDIGDVVFDGFGGGGTALAACEETRRRCLIAEQDLEYCKTIIDRFQHLTHQSPEIIYEEN